MTTPPALAQRWQALARREQSMVLLALGLLGAALLWWVALSPALGTLRTADARHQQLDTQLQQMHALQAQAQALQALPKLTSAQAQEALEASLRTRLGAAAQMTVAGERVSITLKAVPADTLAQWLTQARINARALPTEMRLTRSPGASATAPSWDGSVVLSLPAP